MRAYYQRDVYKLLARSGPLKTREITERLGMPYAAGTHHPTKVCAQVMVKLHKKGLVENTCEGWRVVQGTTAPRNMVGKNPGSLLALRSHSRHNMAKLNAKRGRLAKPIATTALEQCWGWLPSTSPMLQAQDECVAIPAHSHAQRKRKAA